MRAPAPVLTPFDVNGGVDTYAEAAIRLKTFDPVTGKGSSLSAIRTLVREGLLKHVVIGHAHLIPHFAIEEFLRKQATDETHSERRPARLRRVHSGRQSKEEPCT